MRITITEAPNAVTNTALLLAGTVYDVASADRGGRPRSRGVGS